MKASRPLICGLYGLLSLHGWALEGYQPGPWLDEARQRIAQHRMADLRVVVTDSGRPIEGATVQVEMTRHAFPFGSAVTAKRLVADPSGDGERYRAKVTQLFNRVVFENDLKWPAWDQEWGEDFTRAQTLDAIAWLEARDISIRGHCLVWPGWKHLPESIQQARTRPDILEQRVQEHIVEQTSALRGKIAEWDVVNETYWNRDLQNALGQEAMVRWFESARSGDPGAKRFINDARIVSFYGVEPDHKEFYFNEVKYLVDAGAPIDGIGLQCHFREASLTPPPEAVAMFDRFASFGLDLAVTEFDIHTEDEDLQARYLHDFLHVAFSHPAVTQILMWGFWEGEIYKRERALYRADWSAKPSGTMFEDLVFNEWWTRAQGLSTDQGEFRTRGFLGNYRIGVSHGRTVRTVETALGRGGRTLKVELNP